MSSTSAPLTEVEVREMKNAELRVNVERCTRLVGHPTLLQRLPDGGEGIRRRHALFMAELTRRESVTTAASDSAPSVSAEEQRRKDNEAVKLAEAAAMSTPTNAAREDWEKYKKQRVPVEETVRRMYEGTISETELQRIIRSVPPGYFLTYEETFAMEKKLAKEAREAELQKLAAEASQQSMAPQ